MNTDKIDLPNSLKTAVLFLVFNRPETTTKVFEKIRQAKPPRLYVACDGPREGNNNDKQQVTKVCEIATKVDWPCIVKTLFRDKNLGCKKGVSTAITWFFEHEEQGIIFEDDCVPHLDFFTFCENLLDRYAEDERVSIISGNNFQDDKWRGNASYYFSKYNHIWGWASWRRAWKHYQGDIKFWPKWKNSKAWLNYMPDKVERRDWEKIFDQVYAEKIDSWAYPWTTSLWYKGGFTATPNVNLVSNIGFGVEATHTLSEDDKHSNLPAKEIGEIIHPAEIKRNIEAEKYNFNNFFDGHNKRFPRNLLKLPILRLPKRIIKYFLKIAKKNR
ncbi:hypothetical protein N9682_06090 [Candidatus Pelagibacter sp.]|nr:hypothetical protein [Candidatus Pelagibacter sp.]